MGVFDNKNFNSEVFGKYLETVPRVKQNALLEAGVLRVRSDLKSALSEQVGGNYITALMTGLLGGDVLNYDGDTDITATSLDTYSQGMIVTGRAKAWKEKDFSQDITGKDFMAEAAKQVSKYWDDVWQGVMISTLKGVFAMTGAHNFADTHTYDVTGTTSGVVGVDTLNSAIQKAAGANKSIFKAVVLHSTVATNLENLKLLEYGKYTDPNGVQRDMGLATWNGRTVLIDDDVPTEEVTIGNGADAVTKTKYTTYILGEGAFDYIDCGAKVPVENSRDAKTDGGVDWLITRQRHLYAPRGISFIQPSTAIISPTNAQLETGARWNVVKSAGGEWFNGKAIPIARILSYG